jgi:hypothetical protein
MTEKEQEINDEKNGTTIYSIEEVVKTLEGLWDELEGQFRNKCQDTNGNV